MEGGAWECEADHVVPTLHVRCRCAAHTAVWDTGFGIVHHMLCFSVCIHVCMHYIHIWLTALAICLDEGYIKMHADVMVSTYSRIEERLAVPIT